MPADHDRKPVMAFYRLAKIVLSIAYKLFFRFRAFGLENIPNDDRGVIFAPNHASYLDPPLIGVSTERHVTYLAKEYLFRVLIFGTMIRWLGVLPIKSESQDFRSMRQLLRILKEGKRMVIFPEGTRSIDGNFKSVEGGVGFLALKSQTWVVPAYIRGTYDALPKGAKWFKCTPVRIYYGKPFIPSADTAILGNQDPYLAVSEKIMVEITKIKEAVEGHREEISYGT